MVPGPFAVTLDHAQTRVKTHPVFASVRGFGWNGMAEDIWLDKLTGTLMLRPMCRYPDWQSESSGIFAKPAISSYEFETSGNWEEYEYVVGGGKTFMRGANSSANPGWVRTVAAPGLNRGVNLAFALTGAGEKTLLAEFGWDNTSTDATTSAIGFQLYSDGSLLAYQEGEYLEVLDPQLDVPNNGKESYIELMILPCRKRELLLRSQGDGGARIILPTIDEDETSPVIVPAEKFWFRYGQSNATLAVVQIAPLTFEASGWCASVPISFPRPPESGATMFTWTNPVFSSVTNANLYGETAYAGTTDVASVSLVELDGTTAFVADGTLNQARVRITLSGDGSYTPFVYGAVLAFDGETQETDDSEEFDVTPYLRALSLEVPDDPWGARVKMELEDPDALESSVAKLAVVGNRPAKLSVGSFAIMDGRAGQPRYEDSTTGETKVLTLDFGDLTGQLKAFQFRDEFPLDGYYLSRDLGTASSAMSQLLVLAGIDLASAVLTDDSFALPDIATQNGDEWNYSVPIGDDAQQAAEDLQKNFAADWFLGMRPTAAGMRFCFLSPTDLGTTPKMTLYRTVADAVTATAPSTAVYQSFHTETEEVDANEVWVSGQDPRTKQLVQAYAIDETSQDATLAPSARPDNWLGEPKLFGVQDPRFRRQSDVERAVELLIPAVMTRRTFGEFQTPEMLWYDAGDGVMLPVWRGDYVTLDGYGDVQINSLQVDVVVNDDGAVHTIATYTFGGLTGSGGLSLGEIQSKNQARMERPPTLLERMGFGLWKSSTRWKV